MIGIPIQVSRLDFHPYGRIGKAGLSFRKSAFRRLILKALQRVDQAAATVQGRKI